MAGPEYEGGMVQHECLSFQLVPLKPTNWNTRTNWLG